MDKIALVRLESERLVLRRWRPADVQPLAAILLHPDVLPWVGPPDADRDDVARAVDRYDRHWEVHGFGRLAVVDRATGELIGRVGVMREPHWEATACKDEIGWAVDPRRWGEGIATEAAAATLRDVFERAGLEQVVSFASLANTASLRVMAKLGFASGGTAEWKGAPVEWRSLSADRFVRGVSGLDA
ncbi:MAG TPA: GNAT family N-acetyltransferase [Gaiellaceae bacterium]|nr:GNAT family N-acetyltransferase [Gaiellaceae bacterium]